MIKLTWSLKDTNGVRATGKSPTMQIQRVSDSYYWTGIAWQIGVSNLSMIEFGKGLYYYDYTGTLQDLYTFFDEATIPRYSEAFYSTSDLVDKIDALNRMVKDKTYDSEGRLTSCKWYLGEGSDPSVSPIATYLITITYTGQSRDPTSWKAVKQ